MFHCGCEIIHYLLINGYWKLRARIEKEKEVRHEGENENNLEKFKMKRF
jgi:hypothetical protein